MKFKSTYILVALALGLGLFVYFYEIKGGEKRDEAKRKETLVFDIKDEDISWVEIVRPEGEALRVEKTGSGDDAVWRITEPIRARADDGAVGSMTWQLSQFSFSQIADEGTAEFAPFGLVTPELTVNFGTGNGAEGGMTVEFGKKLAVGFDSYARVGSEQRVLVVSNNSRAAFNKQTVDLRDRRVVVFNEEDLVGLEVSTPEYHVEFENIGGDWKISAPIIADADESPVRAILDGLIYLEAEEFFPTIVAQSLGISTPEMTVTVITGAQQRARQTVEFFRSPDGMTGYARPEGDDWLYKIGPDIIDNIPTPLEELRETKVVKFDRWEIEQVRVKRTGGQSDILITKNKEGDWELIEPADKKAKAPSSVMYDLLDSIETLKSSDFVDDPPSEKKVGLKPALVLYKLSEGDNKKRTFEEVAILHLGNDFGKGKQYARGDGPQIFLIPSDFDIPLKTEDYTTEPEPETPSATPEFDEDEFFRAD